MVTYLLLVSDPATAYLANAMSELRKANTAYPYFLTFTVVGWIDVFTRERHCETVLDSLQYCISKKGLLVYAYVIMPSHIHMIARHDGEKLSGVIRDFKSFTATTILGSIENESGESRKEWMLYMFRYYAKNQKQNAKHMFWQKTNYPLELNYPEIFDQKLDYIHHNPVEAGYVNEASAWAVSYTHLTLPTIA